MNEKTTILKVKGIHCEGCGNNVSNALRKVKGVSEADVSFERKIVTVTFDPVQADQDNLEKAIRDAGYELE